MRWKSEKPCEICGKGEACLHHIYTRGARPDLQNEEWNLIAVCQEHHNKFHEKGTAAMAIKHYQVRQWLQANGWLYDNFSQRWYHPSACQ